MGNVRRFLTWKNEKKIELNLEDKSKLSYNKIYGIFACFKKREWKNPRSHSIIP